MTGAQVKSVFSYLLFCTLWDLLVREITVSGPLPRPSVAMDFVLGLQAVGLLLGLLMFGDFYVLTLCPIFLNQSSHSACCFQAGYLFLFCQQVPSAAMRSAGSLELWQRRKWGPRCSEIALYLLPLRWYCLAA